MDRKLSLKRVLKLGSAPLARYLTPFLAQEASALFRDAYFKTILSSLVRDASLPIAVRLAAGDLWSALTLFDGESAKGSVMRRAVVLREALNRYGRIEDECASDIQQRGPVAGTAPGGTHSLPVVVWIPHLRSPFNVGNIIRTCAGFGVVGMVLGEAVPSLSHPRLQRAAMGAVEMVPIARGGWREAVNFPGAFQLTGAPPDVIALETGGVDITRFAFPERGIMVIGHEELGISEDILKECQSGEKVVAIPHAGPKSSLNVGVAAGIGLSWWQAHRSTG